MRLREALPKLQTFNTQAQVGGAFPLRLREGCRHGFSNAYEYKLIHAHGKGDRLICWNQAVPAGGVRMTLSMRRVLPR